jgi:hypothetical protein
MKSFLIFVCTLLSLTKATCQRQDTLFKKEGVSWHINFLTFDPWFPVLLRGEILITNDKFIFHAYNKQSYRVNKYNFKDSINIVIPIDSITEAKKYFINEIIIKTKNGRFKFEPTNLKYALQLRPKFFDDVMFWINGQRSRRKVFKTD